MSEDAGIGVVVDDMFFAAKILGAARTVGRKVRRVTTQDDFEREMAAEPPEFLLIDLNSDRIDAIKAIEFVKSRPELKGVPTIGYFSHVQTELKRRAESAGYDYVIPRSLLSARMNDILLGNLAVLRTVRDSGQTDVH